MAKLAKETEIAAIKSVMNHNIREINRLGQGDTVELRELVSLYISYLGLVFACSDKKSFLRAIAVIVWEFRFALQEAKRAMLKLQQERKEEK